MWPVSMGADRITCSSVYPVYDDILANIEHFKPSFTLKINYTYLILLNRKCNRFVRHSKYIFQPDFAVSYTHLDVYKRQL